MMRRKSALLLAFMMVLCVVLLCAVTLAAAKDEETFDDMEAEGSVYDPGEPEVYITLVNNSGRTFTGIWMGPSSNTKWLARDRFIVGDDYLMLRSGESVVLRPSSASRHGVRYWDIRVDYGRGRKKEIFNIDLYNVDVVELDRNFRVEFQR